MSNYPKTFEELVDMFDSEGACKNYLYDLRWPKGFQCPSCGCESDWISNRFLRICTQCQYQMSLFAGTIFQDTHIPLRTWFHAIWWFTSQKTGTSALGLQKSLGLGSYRTAWMMLHKLRASMVRKDRDKLRGLVEVDETYIGAQESMETSRKRWKKQVVIIATETDGTRLGRIRMQRINITNTKNVTDFIVSNIEKKTKLITDGSKAYYRIKDHGYSHIAKPGPYAGQKRKNKDDDMLPGAHRIASLLKRWILGTYQGRIDPKYLDDYLNEFTFRFNRRTSKARGLLFQRLLENAIQVDPTPYNQIKK